MYVLYSLLLGLAFVFVVPAYTVRLKLFRGEKLHLAERLGWTIPPRRTGRPFLWIHAVSVGEVLSLQHLIREIRARHPEWDVGFSTLTSTGHAVAEAKLQGLERLFFVPFDFAGPVRRVFKALKPDALVLTESEFWPRLLREARRFRCPVILINGRISLRTFKRFRFFKPAARFLLKNIERLLVQSDLDRARLEAIGLDAGRIAVAGNLKCETRLPEFGDSDLRKFRTELAIGENKRVFVAGSIHPGEEQKLLAAFREVRKQRSDLVLVLAPRHPEKFADLERLISGNGLSACRRTSREAGRPWDILILDTIGELAHFYALSDAAFVGGSLVSRGGQNLLEPAYYGKPVFFGPHMENFADLARLFVEKGGARIVETPEELAEMFLAPDPEALAAAGLRAREVLDSLQGAAARTLAVIERYMRHEE